MPSSQTSSTSLIALARCYDEHAWARLTKIYGPAVFGWGIAAGLQHADAADVMQSVFQTVAIRIQDFKHDRKCGSFRGWLCKIFRSKLMDFYRERKVVPIDPAHLEGHFMTADTTANSSLERAQLLRQTLEVIRGDFGKRTWEAFLRSAVENVRTRDVAAELEMTPQAVCAARSRVLRRLRDTLDGLDIVGDE